MTKKLQEYGRPAVTEPNATEGVLDFSTVRHIYNLALDDAISALRSVPMTWQHPEYGESYDIDFNVAVTAIKCLKKIELESYPPVIQSSHDDNADH